MQRTLQALDPQTTDGLLEAAKLVRQFGQRALPARWIPALCIFDDEHYENYDYDVVGPGERRRVVRALRAGGYRQTSGRMLRSPELTFEFPKPTRLLAGDPVAEMEWILRQGRTIPIATPTQVLLVTFRRVGGELPAAVAAGLVTFVHEQPANLDKVRDWLRGSAGAGAFRRLRPALAAAQEEGFRQRRRGAFRSKFSDRAILAVLGPDTVPQGGAS